MRKTLFNSIGICIIFTFLAIIFSPTTIDAAIKKPTPIAGIEKVKATKKSLTFKIQDTQKVQGYQIRVYKGKKLIKTKNYTKTTITVNGLKHSTKYKLGIRAYTKNGSKKIYSKTKNFTYETQFKMTQIPKPGASKSTGKQLQAEYEAWVNSVAEKKNLITLKKLAQSSNTWSNFLWKYGFKYSNKYTNKYDAYKYRKGNIQAYSELFIDICKALGTSAELRDAQYDQERWQMPSNRYTCLFDYKNTTYLLGMYPSESNGIYVEVRDYNSFLTFEDGTPREYRTIITDCPACGTENEAWTDWADIEYRFNPDAENNLTQLPNGNFVYSSRGTMVPRKCINQNCPAYVIFDLHEDFEYTEPAPYTLRVNGIEARKIITKCPNCGHTQTDNLSLDSRCTGFNPDADTITTRCECNTWVYFNNPYPNITSLENIPECSEIMAIAGPYPDLSMWYSDWWETHEKPDKELFLKWKDMYPEWWDTVAKKDYPELWEQCQE